jgi:DNA adenine methylase
MQEKLLPSFSQFKTRMRSSPLRYPGGKSRGVKFLANYVPEFEVFREPFFGGGSLSIALVQQRFHKSYEAGDLNYDLYCFWKYLQSDVAALAAGIQELFDRYKLVVPAVASGDPGKHLFKTLLGRRKSSITDLQRAIDFYVLNRISFSGVVDRGGFSQASFETRFTQSSINKLAYSAAIVKRIDFFHQDYTTLLHKPGTDVFMYLDPPYHAATKSKLYGRGGLLHTHFDHEKLATHLAGIGHKWMITYDDSDFIRDLYKDYYQCQWQLQYGMTNSQQSPSVLGSELLIANYDLREVFEKNTRQKAADEKILIKRQA